MSWVVRQCFAPLIMYAEFGLPDLIVRLRIMLPANHVVCAFGPLGMSGPGGMLASIKDARPFLNLTPVTLPWR